MVVALLGSNGLAQQQSSIVGDYAGTLGPLHLKLHITSKPDGGLAGTLDSVDQNALGLPCEDFHLDGNALAFRVPSVQGRWKGTVTNGGSVLNGTWTQGSEMPLTFIRENASASKRSAVDGVWLGALKAGPQTLRIQLRIQSDSAGKQMCFLDSLDQGAMGLGCDNIKFEGQKFSFDVPAVKGHWEGMLSPDGKNLQGTWNQGMPMPLNFEWQSVAVTVKPPSVDPAMAPVKADDLQSVLDRDLAESLKSGALAPGTDTGVAIGVIDHGVKKVMTYGAAKPESIFEIGSITKTFTGLILAQMVAQGTVRLDEPVRELLPPGTVSKPDGSEITLLDLATQHSGLPRMPDNFNPADPQNPYADYHPANLYAYLAKRGVGKPANPEFLYSNLGFGLLGQALSVRAGMSYSDLLHKEITGPLGMVDTVVVLSPDQQKRFLAGHTAAHQPAHAWDLDAFAGAGAIRSTVSDMLTYMEANLHPEKAVSSNARHYAGAKTLSAALVQSHELRADEVPGVRIALAWAYITDTGSYWHNGATGGYSSFALFDPRADYGVVVLVNMSLGAKGSFAELIGQHIVQRLTGKPAISLNNWQ
ncbi:MAG TPA: serine hydrolase [Terriglobales bacterium]|nr:serine hydrolase [Terriglobales bacterium]